VLGAPPALIEREYGGHSGVSSVAGGWRGGERVAARGCDGAVVWTGGRPAGADRASGARSGRARGRGGAGQPAVRGGGAIPLPPRHPLAGEPPGDAGALRRVEARPHTPQPVGADAGHGYAMLDAIIVRAHRHGVGSRGTAAHGRRWRSGARLGGPLPRRADWVPRPVGMSMAQPAPAGFVRRRRPQPRLQPPGPRLSGAARATIAPGSACAGERGARR
jgi:hypothetical protein